MQTYRSVARVQASARYIFYVDCRVLKEKPFFVIWSDYATHRNLWNIFPKSTWNQIVSKKSDNLFWQCFSWIKRYFSFLWGYLSAFIGLYLIVHPWNLNMKTDSFCRWSHVTTRPRPRPPPPPPLDTWIKSEQKYQRPPMVKTQTVATLWTPLKNHSGTTLWKAQIDINSEAILYIEFPYYLWLRNVSLSPKKRQIFIYSLFHYFKKGIVFTCSTKYFFVALTCLFWPYLCEFHFTGVFYVEWTRIEI